MPRGLQRIDIRPPLMGLHTGALSHLVEDGHFVDGKNVIARDQKLIVRPGYFIYGETQPFTGDAVLAAFTYLDNDGVRRLFVVSDTAIKEWTNNESWTDRTGTALTGVYPVYPRMALYQNNEDSTVILTNGEDVPRKLVYGTNSVAMSTASGAPDKARDVAVVFQRVVFGNVTIDGVNAPSSLLISSKDDVDTYPALNRVDLSDTNDTIVAVRALNSQTFAIHKDNSQWVGVGQSLVYPFTFELRSQAVGPVSPSAVVVVRGAHYYMGQDLDIYRFDGQGAVSVGAKARRTLQSDVHTEHAGKTHGFFDPVQSEIWWFYVSTSHSDSLQLTEPAYPDSAIVYNVETQAFSAPLRFNEGGSSITIPAAVDYGLMHQITWNDLHSYTWNSVVSTYPTWDDFASAEFHYAFIFDANGNLYRFGGDWATDNGSTIDAYFTLPLRNYTGPGMIVRVDAIESYWKQTSAARDLDIYLIGTDTLATTGTELEKQSFNLNRDERHLAKYHDASYRFVAVKSALSAGHALDEHRGLTLFLYPRKAP